MNIKNVNPNKLVDELVNAGIKIICATNDKQENEHIAENTWIEFEDGTDMELVQSIIDNHNPEPTPAQPTLDDYLLNLEFRLAMLELGVM